MPESHDRLEPKEKHKFDFKSSAKSFGIYLLQSLKAFWPHIVIIALLVAADLILKTIIENNIDLYDSVEVIPNFFYLTYTQNPGASFGIFENGMIFFLIITPIALLFFFYLLFSSKQQKRIYAVCLIMIIAGTLGNYSDRLTFGYVRDFARIDYFGHYIKWMGGYSFAIFNLADALLVIGIIIFAVFYIFFYKSKDDKKKVDQKALFADKADAPETKEN